VSDDGLVRHGEQIAHGSHARDSGISKKPHSSFTEEYSDDANCVRFG
jgi:hypothetical protein